MIKVYGLIFIGITLPCIAIILTSITRAIFAAGEAVIG